MRFVALLGSVMWSLAAISCAGSPTSNEVGVASPAAPAPFLDGVTTHVLRASATGRDYQVSVAVPFRYSQSDARFSVLVGVDANGQFGTLVETARILELGGQIPPLVIVGIGFPVGGYQMSSEGRRAVELTPTEVEEYPRVSADAFPDFPAPEGSGRARELFDFMTSDAMPFVDRQYRTRPDGRALYGHSFGGLFAFYALLQSGGAFSRYLIASPSLWWDDGVAFEFESDYARRRRDLPARVFLSVGMEEPDALLPPANFGRMVSNLRTLSDTLRRRNYESLTWESHFFAGENHQSVLAPSISRGLRYLYAK